MNRGWLKFIYACWAPFYDLLIRRGGIAAARARVHERLALVAGERVVMVGVGTGADLPLLPDGVRGVGLDLSRPMLRRAAALLPMAGREVLLVQADADSAPLAEGGCDAALLTLILSVVPDGRRCLAEALRALRPGGRLVVFDKFVAAGARPSLRRRLLNLLTRTFGTDINRCFEDLAEGLPVEVVADEGSLFGGVYRIIELRKPPLQETPACSP